MSWTKLKTLLLRWNIIIAVSKASIFLNSKLGVSVHSCRCWGHLRTHGDSIEMEFTGVRRCLTAPTPFLNYKRNCTWNSQRHMQIRCWGAWKVAHRRRKAWNLRKQIIKTEQFRSSYSQDWRTHSVCLECLMNTGADRMLSKLSWAKASECYSTLWKEIL